jgi:hypothetical protein
MILGASRWSSSIAPIGPWAHAASRECVELSRFEVVFDLVEIRGNPTKFLQPVFIVRHEPSERRRR